ncbi:Crp/Fnr family transcriptional regulator [Vannielia litorea]|uniref:cAMP-binding domain of CRP or a regulatory subunit of cAMP-dependent protein kinases n=1 Tax=Vannielia litorea TaxID=1217970 RepID=A0A1N6IDQ1_9RHOB|nr:Crp/Fnr family transcriptional regulator [Vannielia litorea]SIO30164.1 cAMP-binding domain of CRP or a regulatory subunit of cAMP-dependent protein kinases [Vannielia litorea]
MTPEHKTVARRSLLLKDCPPAIAEEVMARGTVRHVARGATILTPESRADDVFVVLSGWAKLFRITARGGEAVIDVLGPSRSLGEVAALRGERYLVHAEAVTDCALLKIPATAFNGLLGSCTEIRAALLASTLHHLEALVGQVEALKVCSGAQRAAQFILSLVPDTCGRACTVRLPYDKALIAGQVGLSPESLSRAFRRLRAEGVRVHRREVRVDDVPALAAYAEFREAAWA